MTMQVVAVQEVGGGSGHIGVDVDVGSKCVVPGDWQWLVAREWL